MTGRRLTAKQDRASPRAKAVHAVVVALQERTDPSIWRSYEALAEAVVAAAEPHLTQRRPKSAP